MAKHIEFQFDDKLPYQLDAINSTIKLFKGLPKKGDGIYGKTYRIRQLGENEPIRNIGIVTGEKILRNLNKVQQDNNIFTSKKLEGNNFTIEMETGERVIIVMGAINVIKSRVSGTLNRYISRIT